MDGALVGDEVSRDIYEASVNKNVPRVITVIKCGHDINSGHTAEKYRGF